MKQKDLKDISEIKNVEQTLFKLNYEHNLMLYKLYFKKKIFFYLTGSSDF